MCIKVGAQVKTSRKHVIWIGIVGVLLWLLPLVLSAIELEAYHKGDRFHPHTFLPHFKTRDYAIAGVALSAIYILPSILMIFGALVGWEKLIFPWLFIAMVYMIGRYTYRSYQL